MHDSALPDSTLPRATAQPNIALWAMIGIPSATVVASAITLGMAYGGAEPELPERYAWEGAALDKDLARATRARELGLGADIEMRADGRVIVRLSQPKDRKVTAPESLTLHLTHATRPAQDRTAKLGAGAVPGRFEGRLDPLPAARWLVQLEDGGGEWRLRGRLETPARGVRLGH